jgi:hypothetical protein
LSLNGGTIVDAAGNPATITAASVVDNANFLVDTTAPAAPTGLDLAAADDTGTSSIDNITKNTSALTISGSGENGATVTLFDDANNNGAQDNGEATLGTATVSSGAFSTDISLAAGTHHVGAFQTDAGGNVSAGAARLDITVDTTPPTVTSITRQVPTTSPTNADTVTFRVTLGEGVSNVDPTDFTISGTTATVTGVTAVNSSTYDVTISGGNLANLNGTITLGFAGGQNIADIAGNALTNTTPTGTNNNNYVMDNTADGGAAISFGSISKSTSGNSVTAVSVTLSNIDSDVASLTVTISDSQGHTATHTLTAGEISTAASTGSVTINSWTGLNTIQNNKTPTFSVNVTDTLGNNTTVNGPSFPAGSAGSEINLGLHAPGHDGQEVTVTISNVPSGWSVRGGTHNADGTWTVTTIDISSLTVTTPTDYFGAEVLNVTATWTNPDGSTGSSFVPTNVEAYAPGNPIFAWSGDDTLTGSAGADEFVFSQPIGNDVVHSFDASADKIDLIGYSGVASFADVQAHLSADAAGDAVISLADGQSIVLEGVSASSLTAANFEFNATPVVTNSGTMAIGDGALLPLSGTINNSGTIALNSNGGATLLQLIQNGITLQGGGHLVMSDSSANEIVGSLPTVTFTNIDNVISGAGNIGGGSLTLVNNGSIAADGVNALVIDTGSNVVTNSGTLEATGTGGLQVLSSLANNGLILDQSSSILISGDLTGSGQVEIAGNAIIEFGGLASNSIALDANATGLIIFDHSDAFSGALSGLNSDDLIDLKDLQFGASTTLSYTEDGSGNGLLTVSDGIHSAQLHLLGGYQPGNFSLTSDGQGGVLVHNDLLF